jgi:putative oxidoreductase
MAALSVMIAFMIRMVLVLLFFPFSALDKMLNFNGAVAQAEESIPTRKLAVAAICAGLFIEIVMSLCILTGFADRAAAFVLAGYCGLTALLWKQFWKPDDFWTSNTGKARSLFWDFLKNFALAAGFLFITFGTDARSVHRFFEAPLSSTHPYQSSGDIRP